MGQVVTIGATILPYAVTASTVLPHAAKLYKCVIDLHVVEDNEKSKNFGKTLTAVSDTVSLLRKGTEVLKDVDENLSGKVEEMKNSLDYLAQIIEHLRKSGLQSKSQDSSQGVEKIDNIYAELKSAFAKLHEKHQEIDGKQIHGFQKRLELTIRKWTTLKQMKKDLQSILGKIKDAVQKSIELTIILSSSALTRLEILELYNTNKRWPVMNNTVIPPRAPQLFLVKSKGNSFKLSWQRVHRDDNKADYYELCYDDQWSLIFSQSNTHKEGITHEKGTSNEIEIGPPKVSPGIIYVMKIRGINLGGAGKWSNRVVGQLTKPPPCKPDPPIIHSIDASRVVITVTAPTPLCESASAVTEWNVEYIIDGSNSKWSCINYKVKHVKKQQRLSVQNLSRNTRYYFQVQAVNVEGKSDFSQPVLIDTAKAVKAVNVKGHSQTSQAVSITAVNAKGHSQTSQAVSVKTADGTSQVVFFKAADDTRQLMTLTVFCLIVLLSYCIRCVICIYAIQ